VAIGAALMLAGTTTRHRNPKTGDLAGILET
jgi:hypothetical protein